MVRVDRVVISERLVRAYDNNNRIILPDASHAIRLLREKKIPLAFITKNGCSYVWEGSRNPGYLLFSRRDTESMFLCSGFYS